MPEPAFFVLFGVAIVELICWSVWVPPYFRVGISVFSRHSALPEGIETLHIPAFRQEFKGGLGPPILLHPLGPNEVAFREKIISFSVFNYTPLMRGLASVDSTARVLSTRGRLNAYPVAFLWVWISFGLSMDLARDAGGIAFLLFPLGLFAVIYGLQAWRFAKLHDEVLKILERAARHLESESPPVS